MLESAFIEVSPLLQSAAKISPHLLFCAFPFEFPSIFSCECVTQDALKRFHITRPCAALRVAGLGWIVGPEYSLGWVHFGKEYTLQESTY